VVSVQSSSFYRITMLIITGRVCVKIISISIVGNKLEISRGEEAGTVE